MCAVNPKNLTPHARTHGYHAPRTPPHRRRDTDSHPPCGCTQSDTNLRSELNMLAISIQKMHTLQAARCTRASTTTHTPIESVRPASLPRDETMEQYGYAYTVRRHVHKMLDVRTGKEEGRRTAILNAGIGPIIQTSQSVLVVSQAQAWSYDWPFVYLWCKLLARPQRLLTHTSIQARRA